MQHTILKQSSVIVLISLSVALGMQPQTASAEDKPWRLRFSVVSIDPNGNTVTVSETGEQIPYSSSNALGVGIDLEYRASKSLGIDFGVLSASPGIAVEVGVQPFTVSANGDLSISPIYAALNIHLTPDSPVDLYIGPLLAYVKYGGFNLAAGPGLNESFSTDNDFGFGGVVGLDVDLGDSRWIFNATVRYIDTSLTAASSDGGPGTTDIDPVIYSLGIGFKF